MAEQVDNKPTTGVSGLGQTTAETTRVDITQWQAELPTGFDGIVQNNQVAWSRAGLISERMMRAPHNGVPLSELPPDVARAVLEARAEAMKTFFETIADGIIEVARANAKAHRRNQINKELLMPQFRRMAEGTRDRVASDVIGDKPTEGTVTEPGDEHGAITTQKSGDVVGPVGPRVDIAGDEQPAVSFNAALAPALGAGTVGLFDATVGQDGAGIRTQSSGPVFSEPLPSGATEEQKREAVRGGLTQRLGYAPHADVVRMVMRNVTERDDGRIQIPDRAAIIQMYVDRYGINPDEGQVVIAGENDRWSDVLEDIFFVGDRQMPWGARGLLIRTVMNMNEMDPRHNMEMPGVVVLPKNEADFAKRALAENGFAGQETQRYTGETVEPSRQVETLSYYLTRVLNQPVSEADVHALLDNPSASPTAGSACARTQADEHWPRDAILEAYQDLFHPEHPDFKDIPRERLAAMIMMTVAQSNNLGPEAFAGCSKIYFIDSNRMTDLVRDMHLERDSRGNNVFDAFDSMAANTGRLTGDARATAELWNQLTQTHAVGSAQVVARLLDGQQMPLVLIDSASLVQPLSREDMNQVFALLSSSAYVRGSVTNPYGGPFSFFGPALGGVMEMMSVMAAAITDPNARQDGETMGQWFRRRNPDLPEKDYATFERQVATVKPLVDRVIDDLTRIGGSGEGWHLEDGHLVFDDAVNFRDIIASMGAQGLSRDSQVRLERWVEGCLERAAGRVSIDLELTGTLYEIDKLNKSKPRKDKSSINTFQEDVPFDYLDLDSFDYPPGTYSFSTTEPEANNGLLAQMERKDLRFVESRPNQSQKQVEAAQKEIREHAAKVRNQMDEVRHDVKKYKERIDRMNQLISQWEEKGKWATGGPLVSFLDT